MNNFTHKRIYTILDRVYFKTEAKYMDIVAQELKKELEENKHLAEEVREAIQHRIDRLEKEKEFFASHLDRRIKRRKERVEANKNKF